MKRREFLNSSLVAGATAFLTPAGAMAGVVGLPKAKTANAPPHMTRAWFVDQLHSRFRIEVDGGERVDAQLVAVEDRPIDKRLDQFSVVFRVPEGADVGGPRWVNHATAGRFQLFLDTTVPASGACTSAAQFCLLT